MRSERWTLSRTAGALLVLVVAAFVGCADILGLPERTESVNHVALRDADVEANVHVPPIELGLDAGDEECDGPKCTSCEAKSAELSTWTRASPIVSPNARSLAAMAYDATRKQVVLFGGLNNVHKDGATGDTWVWNGVSWSGALPVKAPSRRFAAAMVTDLERDELVLFGGQDHLYATLGDTWVWNGAESSWTQRCGPGRPCGPSPRMMHALAYDSHRHRVVMFGGGRALVDPALSAVGSVVSETWEWDGEAWAEICGPTQGTECALAGQRGAAMAYDPQRERVVLYGGEGDRVRDEPNLVNRTWEYDGDSWSRRDDIARVPPPRSFASMTWDSTRKRIVLHGGVTAFDGERLSDTWEYDGTCWKDVTNPLALPDPRGFFSSSFDQERGELVVFGGLRNAKPDDSTDTTSIRASRSR